MQTIRMKGFKIKNLLKKQKSYMQFYSAKRVVKIDQIEEQIALYRGGLQPEFQCITKLNFEALRCL